VLLYRVSGSQGSQNITRATFRLAGVEISRRLGGACLPAIVPRTRLKTPNGFLEEKQLHFMEKVVIKKK